MKITPGIASSLLLFLLIGFCFFLCYHFLQPGIKSWDEAVYANNAIEMSKSGNVWTMFRNGHPDLYNTKPPFVIWLQSIFISIVGLNELAIRLPSFISLFCLVIILFNFLNRKLNDPVFPFITISILLSAGGFSGFHSFATGDLDATLCLWITLYSLLFFDKIFLTNSKPAPKYIYLFALFFILAFLTKSTAAFLPVPGLMISLFIFKKQKILLLDKHFYIAVFLIASFIAGYYGMMEIKTPGYFSAAWNSEFKRIYSNIMPWHEQPFIYYSRNLGTRFFPWCWLLIPSIFFTIRSQSAMIKKLMLFSSVFVCSYLLIISIPAVKLEWYDLPLYPFMAIIAAISFYELFLWMRVLRKPANSITSISCFVLFTGIIFFFLTGVVKKIHHPSFEEPLEREGNALNQLIDDPVIHNLKIWMYADHPEHYNQVNFYREKYYRKKAAKPVVISNEMNIQPGDTVLLCQLEKFVLQNFNVDTLQKTGSCLLLHIKSRSK